MKKISKLVINPEKLMTDGELVTLKGGYDCGCGWEQYYCVCYYVDCQMEGPGCIPDDVISQSTPAINEYARTHVAGYQPISCDCVPMM